ncbi:DUF4344 domain-containing metallopeptidase [Streptosporangium sp. NPDC000396]|uniref:DUF4344 domain-containing metallopeptidase n=1 Tax=Streptosporangium sp. NPDC000396 TaxID=3366185 RepID=UPI0036CCD711
MWNRLVAAGAGALLLATTLTACGGAQSSTGARAEVEATPAVAKETGGRFVVAYGDAKEESAISGKEVIQASKVLEGFADALNGWLTLPEDITLTGEECGQVNAFYSPDEKKITFCYELVADGFARYRDVAESEEENIEHGRANLVDTLFHELGHAVIDIYDLPALGKEDDAADQLSAYLLTKSGDDSLGMQTINYYFHTSQDQDRADLPFYDEHSMDEQRAYNYMCWMYGSDPDAYADWVGEQGLPENRAGRCPDEYRKIANAWEKLLAPHVKS